VLTDYDILRISKTQDVSTIRKAYRKIVKEIHPDVSKESDLLENHLLFIQINRAYERLIGQTGNKDTLVDEAARSTSSGSAAVVEHKDPAYVFYKTAMTHFMKIHPSQWSVETKQILEKPGPQQEEELKIIKEKVKDLVKLFPMAYYYFCIVVHEYPHSVWFQDSKEKMSLIEERTVRYQKIIESFTEHVKDIPRVNKMFFSRRELKDR